MYENMTFVQVCGMPGVKDIQPAMAKGKFAQALIAEAKGEHEQASGKLNEAVALCAA